ncbi:hypothetical protein BDV59DRAFT_117000 [Aspergillus ambiguus]|uniref:uncharacterized protein n=1 Tax=Aspergillus ambiguus TaxID=176160 RepID=UPI003CCCFC42
MAVDRSAAVRAVAAVFMSFACTAVLLRCYVRIRLVRAFGWDDITMLIATGFYIMFSACMIGGSLYGTGKHFTELTAHQSVVAMKYWFLCDLGYALASILSKVSVCLLLLRVLIAPAHRTIIYVVTAITVITGIVFFIFCLVQCSPPSFFWERFWEDETISGSCGHLTAIEVMLYLFSAVSASFDFTVALLPIFVVRKLQMSRQTKVAAVCLLGMACIASVAVIVRIPFVHTIKNPDFLYATVQIAIWSNIETGLSIFAGSLATLRPLFSRFTGSEVTGRLHYNSASARQETTRRSRRIHHDQRSSITQLADLSRSARDGTSYLGKGTDTTSVHSLGDLSGQTHWQEAMDPNASIHVFQSWDVSSSHRSSRVV